MEYSKIKLAVFWVMGGFVSSLIGVIPSVMYWANANPDWEINVIGQIFVASTMAPLGWLYCAILPVSFPSTATSWVSVGAFLWACRIGRRSPLYVSYVACFVFGIFWPMTLWDLLDI